MYVKGCCLRVCVSQVHVLSPNIQCDTVGDGSAWHCYGWGSAWHCSGWGSAWHCWGWGSQGGSGPLMRPLSAPSLPPPGGCTVGSSWHEPGRLTTVLVGAPSLQTVSSPCALFASHQVQSLVVVARAKTGKTRSRRRAPNSSWGRRAFLGSGRGDGP